MDSAEISLAKAFQALRTDGYRVSGDKLYRLRDFGISSARRGRGYVLTDRAYSDLRFVLAVEEAYALHRDHDTLALELAYLAYPSTPWPRAHDGVLKRIDLMLMFLNREIHRFNSRHGTGFHSRRLPHVARQLARHYISPRAIRERPRYALARELLERVFLVLLRVSYLEHEFLPMDVQKLLLDFGLGNDAAGSLAPMLAALLNEVLPMLLMNRNNFFLEAASTKRNTEDIRETFMLMRTLDPLYEQLQKAVGTNSLVRQPQQYPHFDVGNVHDPKASTALHASLYAMISYLRRQGGARIEMQKYAAGETDDIDQAISNFSTMVVMIKRVFDVP